MKRLLLAVGLLFLTAAGLAQLWSGRFALGPLTPQAIAALEPEACTVSPWTIAFTAVVPILPRAYTRDTSLEQIALIDEYKLSGWRKVWILRMPRAFITGRTCDAGRKNWIGEGDDRRFGQHYEIDAVVTNDDIIPITRADQSQRDAGVPVEITIENALIPPDRRGKTEPISIRSLTISSP